MNGNKSKKTLRRERIARGVLSTGLSLAFAYGALNVLGSNSLSRHMEGYSFVVDQTDVDRFIKKYKGTIEQEARRTNVPPEVIANTLRNENVGRPIIEDLKDSIGTLLGMNTSLGVGQVNIETARDLDTYYKRNTLSRSETVDRLRNPEINIAYMADFYRREMRANGLLGDRTLSLPDQLAKLGSSYVGGRQHKSSLANGVGLSFLAYFTAPDGFAPFDRNIDRERIQSQTKEFLCSRPKIRELTARRCR